MAKTKKKRAKRGADLRWTSKPLDVAHVEKLLQHGLKQKADALAELTSAWGSSREELAQAIVLISDRVREAGYGRGYPKAKTVLEWVLLLAYTDQRPGSDPDGKSIIGRLNKNEVMGGVYLLAALNRANQLPRRGLKRWLRKYAAFEQAITNVSRHVPHWFVHRVHPHQGPSRGKYVGVRLVSIKVRYPIGVEEVRTRKNKLDIAPSRYRYLTLRFSPVPVTDGEGSTGAMGQVWLGVDQTGKNLFLASEYAPRTPMLSIADNKLAFNAGVGVSTDIPGDQPSYLRFPNKRGRRGPLPEEYLRRLELAGVKRQAVEVKVIEQTELQKPSKGAEPVEEEPVELRRAGMEVESEVETQLPFMEDDGGRDVDDQGEAGMILFGYDNPCHRRAGRLGGYREGDRVELVAYDSYSGVKRGARGTVSKVATIGGKSVYPDPMKLLVMVQWDDGRYASVPRGKLEHVENLGDYRGGAGRGYVIVRTDDGKYVTPPGSQHSYTKDIKKALVFPTERKAKQHGICGNELIVPAQ